MEKFQKLASEVFDAAFAPDLWPGLLREIARSNGGEFGQLMGVHPHHGLQFHFANDLSEEMARDFETRGGSDPAVNPRARVWHRPVFRLETDETLASADELKSNSFLNEVAYKYDTAEICITRLPTLDGVQTCLAISRTSKQAAFHEANLSLMAAMLPQVAAAIRLRLRIEEEITAAVAGTLESTSKTAFVLNGSRKVVGATASAERILKKGDLFVARHGSISATVPASNTELETALNKACTREAAGLSPRQSEIIIKDRVGARHKMIISPFPARYHDLRFGPVAIVVVCSEKTVSPSQPLLSDRFGLTPAEATIVLALSAGQSTAQIAARRTTSIGTVRSQIKSIFQKTDTNSRVSLLRKVTAF